MLRFLCNGFYYDWIISSTPELLDVNATGNGRINTKSRLKNEVLLEQEIKQLLEDKDYQAYKNDKKVRVAINFAKEDGKLNIQEIERIYKFIDEAKSKDLDNPSSNLVKQL